MTARLDKDPYRNFRFRVELDGIEVAAFTEVTIPDSTTEMVEYREGTDAPNLSRKLSGQSKNSNLTLKKGINENMELWDWKKAVEDKGADSNRKNVSIIVIDEEGNDKSRWDIVEAWPIKYGPEGLNAGSNDVIVEEIEICHEGITRTK